MPEFKTKEEYEKWKAERFRKVKEKTEEKQKESAQPSSVKMKESENVSTWKKIAIGIGRLRKLPTWKKVLIGIGGWLVGSILVSMISQKDGSAVVAFLLIYPFTTVPTLIE